MKTSALLLAAAAFSAGCLGAGMNPTATGEGPGPALSAVLWTALTSEGVLFPSFDGTDLSMQIYRPVVPEGERVPIIVNFSPYWGNSSPTVQTRGDNFSKWLIDEFVLRGYAVVLASVRGTGSSGGCFEMGGANEIEDTKLTVEWLASQPWSNGKVGAIAKSYDGTVANMAAISAPEGLATIVPVSGITEWYYYLHTGGLVYGGGTRAAFTDSYYLRVGWGVEAIPDEGLTENPAGYLLSGSLIGPSYHPEDACPHLAEASLAAAHTGGTGDYTSYWQERNYIKDVGNAKASLFLIHGLQDFNVQPDQIAQWYNAYPGPKKAMLGQWDHLYPTRDDFGSMLLRWFDSELKGIDNGVWDEPAVQVQSDACAWRYEEDFPPTRATPLVHYPQADGTLAADGGTEGALSYRQSPSSATLGSKAGDHLEFIGAPLAAPTHMSGIAELRFTAMSDRPVTAFTGVLFDLAPDGSWRDVNWAFLSATHRNGLETSEPLMPGESAEYVLKFYPQDTVFAAGHRIGLGIASSNLGTHVYVQPLMPFTAATNTISVGPSASLSLPIVNGEDLLLTQPIMRPALSYPYADWEANPVELACTPEDE